MQNICTQCGICCTGTLFSYAGTSEPSARSLEKFIDTGGSLYKQSDELRFDLPCTAYCDGVCSIYEHRLQVCKDYKCALLLRYEAEEVDTALALAIINQARDLSARIRTAVGDHGPSLYDMLCEEMTAENVAALKRKNPGLLLDIATLSVIRDQYFYEVKANETGASKDQ